MSICGLSWNGVPTLNKSASNAAVPWPTMRIVACKNSEYGPASRLNVVEACPLKLGGPNGPTAPGETLPAGIAVGPEIGERLSAFAHPWKPILLLPTALSVPPNNV